jgi:hypothetical protein
VHSIRKRADFILLHVYITCGYLVVWVSCVFLFPFELSWHHCQRSFDHKHKYLFLDSQFHSINLYVLIQVPHYLSYCSFAISLKLGSKNLQIYYFCFCFSGSLAFPCEFFSVFSSIGVWTEDLHIEPLHQPFFCKAFFFRDRVSRTICLDWLQTAILLVSASEYLGLDYWCELPSLWTLGISSQFLHERHQSLW